MPVDFRPNSGGSGLPAAGADGSIPVAKDGAWEAGVDKDPKGNSFAAQAGFSGASVAVNSQTLTDDDDNTSIETAAELEFNAFDALPREYLFYVSDLLAKANDGRIELTTATLGNSLSWIGHDISLWNATAGKLVLVKPSSAPALLNTATDLDAAALVAGTTPYALYAEYSSATTFNIVAKKWTNATTRAVALADWLGFKVYDLTDAGKQRRHIGDVLPYHHWKVEGAYAAGTNYESGASCTSGGHTYISLHANNLGNAPPSAAHWQDCGAAYDNRGVFCRQTNLQLILNAYNQEDLTFGVVNPYTVATSEALTNTAAFQVVMKDAQGNSPWKAECLCPGKVRTSLSVDGIGGSASAVFAAVGVDSMTVPHANSPCVNNGTLGFQAGVTWNADLSEGYHYLVPLVAAVANPRTAYYYALNGSLASCLFQFLGTWRG